MCLVLRYVLMVLVQVLFQNPVNPTVRACLFKHLGELRCAVERSGDDE